MAGLLAAALAGPLYFRCEAQRWGEHGANNSVQHLRFAGADSLVTFEHSLESLHLKDVKETSFTYEWCDCACGEYVEAGRRFRAGPYVFMKRSRSLSQVLVELTPSGGVKDQSLKGHCEGEDAATFYLSQPIID